jgi:hypothetical protein
LPFVWGSVTIDLTVKSVDGTEKSGSTDNAFSIQTNTNVFPCSKCKDNSPFAPTPKVPNSASKKGDKGWVQFVYQQFHTGASTGKGNTNLCVWNVDVTIANNTANQAGYAPKCVYPSKTEAVAPLEGKDAPTGAAEVIGYVKCAKENSDADCKLWVVAKLPWSPGSGWWSVSAPDSMGLAGKWTNVSGTMLGPGGGAEAVFTKTQIKNVLRAYDCYKSPASKSKTTPVACPGPPAWDREGRAFDLTATPANYFPTGESNNLTNGPVKFTCGTGDCWLTYNSNSPKN